MKRDTLIILIFLSAFLISINILDGLLFDILGIAFFIAMCYGIISIHKNTKFIFN